MTIRNWCARIHRWAHDKGFYLNSKCTAEMTPCEHASEGFIGQMMLVVTEASEAVEGYRNGDEANVAEEIADTVIRLFDIAYCRGIDLEKEIGKKMDINEGRPHMHGKRC